MPLRFHTSSRQPWGPGTGAQRLIIRRADWMQSRATRPVPTTRRGALGRGERSFFAVTVGSYRMMAAAADATVGRALSSGQVARLATELRHPELIAGGGRARASCAEARGGPVQRSRALLPARLLIACACQLGALVGAALKVGACLASVPLALLIGLSVAAAAALGAGGETARAATSADDSDRPRSPTPAGAGSAEPAPTPAAPPQARAALVEDQGRPQSPMPAGAGSLEPAPTPAAPPQARAAPAEDKGRLFSPTPAGAASLEAPVPPAAPVRPAAAPATARAPTPFARHNEAQIAGQLGRDGGGIVAATDLVADWTLEQQAACRQALAQILQGRPLISLEPGNGVVPRVTTALRADLGRMRLSIHGPDSGEGTAVEQLLRVCNGSAAQLHALSDVLNQSLFAELTYTVPEAANAWPMRWRDVPLAAIVAQGSDSRLGYDVSRLSSRPGWVRLAASFNAPVMAVNNAHPRLGFLPCDASLSWARWSAAVLVGPADEHGCCPRAVEMVSFLGRVEPRPGATWTSEPPEPSPVSTPRRDLRSMLRRTPRSRP